VGCHRVLGNKHHRCSEGVATSRVAVRATARAVAMLTAMGNSRSGQEGDWRMRLARATARVAVSATAGGSDGEVMDWCWRDVREVCVATAAKVDGQLYV
jgi:hypothetical protein